MGRDSKMLFIDHDNMKIKTKLLLLSTSETTTLQVLYLREK